MTGGLWEHHLCLPGGQRSSLLQDRSDGALMSDGVKPRGLLQNHEKFHRLFSVNVDASRKHSKTIWILQKVLFRAHFSEIRNRSSKSINSVAKQ